MPSRHHATSTLHHYLERLPRGRRSTRSCPAGQPPGDALAIENLGLVVGIARRYWFDGVALDDLIQAGNVGLLRAARRFDGRRNTNPTTWLSFGIRRAILDHLAHHQHVVALPRNVHQRLVGTRPPTGTAVGPPSRGSAGVPVGVPVGASTTPVRRLLAVSIDESDTDERHDRATLALPAQADDAPIAAERAAMHGEVAALLDVLDDQARRLIVERFGLDGATPRGTMAQAADRGVGREAIRLRYNAAMAKLTTEARRRHLEQWLAP